MKKTGIDWANEFQEFARSGLSQPAYSKKRGIKKTTFRYNWARRNKSSKSEFDGVSRGLLKSHIRTCVTERIRGNDSKILEEFIRTIGYVLR
ncbi:hypothetical protein FH602_08235 [Leptospira kirschneri]|nr:hypothetical protein [Leptospira kirschneri]UML81584.1 hypothetical protein FH602_08235 [Leptospira kirschneri]